MTGNAGTSALYYSIRREFWENRSLYLAPLAAAALFFLGFLVVAARLPATMRDISTPHTHGAIAMTYHMGSGLLMLTVMVVGAFYSVDALYGERRDRSILFWKSMPVSDTTAVLAKASIPIVLLPLLAFALTIVLHAAMLLVSCVVLWMNGLGAGMLWAELSLPRATALLLYHWLTVHVLWEAPLYGWLFLISAWARRAPLVWAFLPPFAIGVLERLIFGSSHFADMINRRLSGGGMEAITAPGTFPMDPRTHATVGPFLSSPGLWIGLALTAIFLAASIRLRRQSGPVG